MIKFYLKLLSALLFFTITAKSQVTLTGTSYAENFDNIASGLPTGWTVRTGASSTNLGTAVNLTTAATAWNNTSGAFKNFASADGLNSSSTPEQQAASADRSLGIRQTGNLGDPGAAFVLQLTNTAGLTNFTLTFKGQSLDVASTRSVTWAVDFAIGNTPTGFSTTTPAVTFTTGGTTFKNDPITVNFGSSLDNKPENVWIRIVALTGSTGTGTRPSTGIDDVELNYSQGGIDDTPPTIVSFSPANNATNVVSTLTTAGLSFTEAVVKGTGSIVLKKASDNTIVQSFDIAAIAVNVTNNVVTFPVALSAGTGYYVEITPGAFKDNAGNNFAGISGNNTWTFTTGTLLYSATFNTCATSPTEGFTQYSVTGSEVWACTTFGRDANNSPSGSAPNGVQINGFSGGTNVPNEDWLISPAFNLTGTTFPLLTFYSRTAFNGVPLQLKVSTNYSGTGDPRLATWINLEGRFPNQASDIWTASSQINLSAFKQPSVYIAFVYVSTSEEGARWTLDDVSIDNSATPPAPTLTISTSDVQFGFAAAGTNATKSFTMTGNDLTGDITVTSTANFLVSVNGTDFSSSVTYSQANANNTPLNVYVRFSPVVNDQNYTGNITVVTSGITSTITTIGTSIDPAKTLEIVNWNIEWFGSTSNGPADKNQQEQNVKTIMQNIGADVYALAEVVDTARLGNVVRSLPGYSYVVSNYASHTNTTETNPGPLEEGQKLGFVYKTSMFSNVTTTALLSLGINTAADVASVNYNNWSSGRYPYMMSADVTLNGVTRNIKFIVVHAKANTSPTIESYNRRKAGADSLQKLLSTMYGNDNLVILGDFNDDLDSTITAGIRPAVTSYSTFISDSVNFPSLTLPLSKAGKKSTVSYNDMIDHVVVSDEMKQYYINSSANVLTDVTSLVSSFGTSTSDHYPVFTRFAFDATILPVQLFDFKAEKKSSAVELTWKTAQELNAKEFEIERRTEAAGYTTIGKLRATGNSNTTRRYSFTDKKPAAGNNLYRLKQIDNDGKSMLSKEVNVNFAPAVTLSLTPNPASTTLTVQLINISKAVTLQLVDINGKVTKQQFTKDPSALIQFDVTDMSAGYYLLKVVSDKTVIAKGVIIK